METGKQGPTFGHYQKPESELTEAQRIALNAIRTMPRGWFKPYELPIEVLNPVRMCHALYAAGWLDIEGDYVPVSPYYRLHED